MRNPKFNDEVVLRNIDEVMKVNGVGKMTLTYEASSKILSLLKITALTSVEEIRAIRNSVVKYFSDKIETECLDENDNWKPGMFKVFDKYNMWMSAITGAIDNAIFNRGAEV